MELPELARPLPEQPVPGEPPSIVELVRRGTVDAELAALLWLFIEGRIPVVVAGPEALVADGTAGDALRGLLASLRPDLGLEADLHHRRDDLGGLAAAGVTSIAEVGRLVAGYRVGYGHAHGSAGH